MAIALVQDSAATAQTAVTAFTVAWPQNTVAGNLLVALLHLRGNHSVTNAQGWTQAATIQNGATCQVEIWYKANCGASEAAPSFSVVVSLSGVIEIMEFSGISVVTPLNQTGTTTATNAAAVLANTTPPRTELVVSACGDSQGVGADTWLAPTFTSAGGVELNKLNPPTVSNGMDAAYYPGTDAAGDGITYTLTTGTACTMAAALATFRAVGTSPAVTYRYAAN